MASVAVTRDDLSSVELRVKAAGTADAKQARRLLAMAMILDGHPRQLAAQAGGMDRQTLRARSGAPACPARLGSPLQRQGG
ncbi:MAG TPA: hypothetical protein VGC15_09920 [Acetobacteraceae bacterium]